MPVPEFKMTRSIKPVHAQAEYMLLDPCIVITDRGDWQNSTYGGSGFLIDDLIHNVWWYSSARKCGYCGSVKTLCIYLKNDVSQFNCDVSIELVCRKCGRYTQYTGTD